MPAVAVAVAAAAASTGAATAVTGATIFGLTINAAVASFIGALAGAAVAPVGGYIIDPKPRPRR